MWGREAGYKEAKVLRDRFRQSSFWLNLEVVKGLVVHFATQVPVQQYGIFLAWQAIERVAN
jgi:hypothetical protein